MDTSPPLPVTWSLGVASFSEPLKSGRLSTAGFLAKSRELGFRSVELCDLTVDHNDPVRTRAMLAAVGLAAPSVAVRTDFTTAGQAPEDMAKALRWLELSRQAGARVMRVYTGIRAADAMASKLVVSAFDEIVPAARGAGVTLVVETHGGLSNDIGFLRFLVERYQGGIGICIDFGNVPREQHVWYVESLAFAVKHVHVKSYDFRADGQETTLDLPRCLGILRQRGYEGQWVVEYEGKPPHEEGILRTVAIMAETLL